MPIFRWGSPLQAFQDLEREMDLLMRSMDLAFEGLRLGRPYPPVNLYELEEEFLLMAELPGTRVEDLDISVANGVLTMRGNRVKRDNVAEESYRRSERPEGPWERSLSLPERVDEERISAEMSNGLLRLHLPKMPSSEPRQISVNLGDS